MLRFDHGEDLREVLPELKVGTTILYHNIRHKVIDAGPEQGKRIAVLSDDEQYDCPIHGLQEGCDCPRC